MIIVNIMQIMNKAMKILIIDDERFLVENLSKYLEKKIPSDIRCVDSACEALALIKTESFDLIICDLNLSDQPDGDLIRSISQVVPAQKFIVISAKELPADLKENKNIHISAYFEKPFNISDFEETIKKMETINFSNADV